MSSGNQARRTSVDVVFDGVNITKSIRPYLLGLTYTDCEEGQADDLQLRLQDRGGLWRESWLASMLEGAVKSRLKRGRDRLKKIYLEREGENYEATSPCHGP